MHFIREQTISSKKKKKSERNHRISKKNPYNIIAATEQKYSTFLASKKQE